jgi:hypothetical protein
MSSISLFYIFLLVKYISKFINHQLPWKFVLGWSITNWGKYMMKICISLFLAFP